MRRAESCIEGVCASLALAFGDHESGGVYIE